MSNGHIPPVRNPGPPDVDWSQAPEGATHFCTRQRLWYAKSPGGAWYFMEPFNEKYGWCWSNLDPKHLKDLVPRPTSVGPEIDWSQAPEGATHYLPGRKYPWRRLIGGLVHVWLPPTGWVVTSTIGPLAQQSRGVLSEEGIPRPAGKVICSECHGNGFVRDHSVEEMIDHKCCATCAGSGEVDPAKPEGTSGKAEQDERPEDEAVPPSVPLSVDVTLFAEAINYSLGDVGQAYTNLARDLENVSYEQAAGRLDRRQFPAPGYERLHDVYQDAHHQAAYGKGNERHANDLPFHEQRMQTISQGLNSPDGMAYQVIKKVQEGLQMKDAGARRRELLGALNYLAGIVIFLDDREAGGDV